MLIWETEYILSRRVQGVSNVKFPRNLHPETEGLLMTNEEVPVSFESFNNAETTNQIGNEFSAITLLKWKCLQ